MNFKLLLLFAILCVSLSSAAEDKPRVVKFRPITREEYNEILKLTNGKPTISEARLISSGLAVFKNLVTFTSGFWPNVLSVFGITQTSAADVDNSQVGSYPLCVVQTDKIGKQHQQQHESEGSGLDCIIVVRENEQPEEQYEQEYYEDFEPTNMLPDYQHWPYAAAAVPSPPPPPAPMPYNPYYPTPYAYNPYQYYPYYSGYSVYGPPPPPPPSPQIPFAQLSQPQLGNPGEYVAQNQQQTQQQGDFYQQPGFSPYPIQPYHPQFAPPAPPAQAQTNHNANNGPVVHVIRGDKRDLASQHKPLKVRRYSVGPPIRMALGEERHRRKSFRKLDENGYRKTYVPQQQYRDTYAKVSLSRSAEYNHPVYIMNAEDLY